MKKLFDMIWRHADSIFLISIIIFGVTIFIRSSDAPKDCTEVDVYALGDWGECNANGIMTRTIEKKDMSGLSCANPDSVERPLDVRACEYIPSCVPEDAVVTAWGICFNGAQTREITFSRKCVISKADESAGTFAVNRSCEDTKSVLLLRNYTTQTDQSLANPYQPSYRNVLIRSQGKISSLRLVISAKTTVLGGADYNVPNEYYYFPFSIDDGVARALDTSRIGTSPSRLDLSDRGIVRGSEMPTTISFDLSDVRLAKTNEEGIGFVERNFLNYLNSSNGKDL